MSRRRDGAGGLGGLRHQGGFIRGAIVLFVVLTIVGMLILDILSVYTAHRTLGEQTRSAAEAAATAYVQSSNDASAEQAAAQYLSEHGSTLVKIVPDHANGLNVYTVTAKRGTKTYFFHYFARLPKIGGWIDRQLHPQVTGDNLQ
jgi:predicted metalloprotease